MMFDRLCGIIETHIPELIPMMHKAHLFDLPIIPHEELPKAFESNTDEFEKEFFLPFRVTAIEDKVSCIVFADLYKGQIGMSDERFFIECLSLGADHHFFRESLDKSKDHYKDEYELARAYHQSGYAVVSIGSIYNMYFKTPKEFYGEGSVSSSILANKKEIKFDKLHLGIPEQAVKPPLINAYSAIQEIVYFNRPTNFILEEKPVKQRKSKSNKIPRSMDRPLYTILNPFQIRKRMHLPQPIGTHASPIPHERRRHDRWLSDNRYAFKDGKSISPKIIPFGKRKGEIYYKHVIVPASWIGPSENTFKNKHYKVILNR